jgi:hypothetical protein
VNSLLAGSTCSLTYTPLDATGATYSTAPSVAFALKDAAGSAVTVAGDVTWSDTDHSWTVEVAADEIPIPTTDEWWYECWTWTADGQETRHEVPLLVTRFLAFDTLCNVGDVQRRLGTEADPEFMDFLIRAASAAIRSYRHITVPSVTETRNCLVDGCTVFLEDNCSAVTAVTDADAAALTYTAVPGYRASDPMRWLTLATPRAGYVKVSATWGYDDVPENYRLAALETVAVWWKRAKAGGEDPYAAIGNLNALPRQAMGLLG